MFGVYTKTMHHISKKIVKAFRSGNKVIICGNGGSATMASHFAGEFLGKFEKNRDPLPAMSLADNLAAMTAIANDYGYHHVFSRQVEAFGKEGDILIILSTSGKSFNCLLAAEMARLKNLVVIDFPREGNSSATIQEYQTKLMHDVCREVERELFPL